MEQLQGKVVIISGASSGIGEALAREFFREGARLVLLARRLDRLVRLQTELDPGQDRTLILACDVCKDEDVTRAVEEAQARFGGLDIVVANAGFGVGGPLARLGLDDYRRQFETNVFGVLRLVKAALPSVTERRGQIVLMGSVAGYISMPHYSPYAMSKFAVRALASALRHEVQARGVAVTLISPGYVISEIQQVDNQGRFDPKAKRFIPDWLSMPTDKAARQMVAAIRRRRSSVVITGHGKALVFMATYMSWGMDFFVSQLSRFQRYAKERRKPQRNPAG